MVTKSVTIGEAIDLLARQRGRLRPLPRWCCAKGAAREDLGLANRAMSVHRTGVSRLPAVLTVALTPVARPAQNGEWVRFKALLRTCRRPSWSVPPDRFADRVSLAAAGADASCGDRAGHYRKR
jgi:hypothetical protein